MCCIWCCTCSGLLYLAKMSLVTIGMPSGNADGVLVLEPEDKAMILPKVAVPQLNVKNPYSGMMCYEIQPVKH